MMNEPFTLALTALLALILVYAAVRDVQTYTISNKLVLAVALLAPSYWLAAGIPLWPDASIRIGVALVVFFLLAIGFYINMMGGGDVKLGAALALWFTPFGTMRFLLVMSLAGAVVTILAMISHKKLGKEGKTKVPYGVAIAVGALFNLAQRFLNHFG